MSTLDKLREALQARVSHLGINGRQGRHLYDEQIKYGY